MAFPTTGLAARYEALLDTGHTDAEPLATIEDQSGNARHLTQATAGKQPTYRTGIVGGQPAYRLDGVDDIASWSGTVLQPAATTISVVVSSSPSEATSRKWPFTASVGTVTIHALTEGVTTGEWGTFARTNSATVQQTTAGVDTTAWCVLTLVWDGANATLYRNGAQVATNALAGIQQFTEISIGALVSLATECFGGDVALAGAWTVALDATARADLHTYVQDTYGITVSDYSGGAGIQKLRWGASTPGAFKMGPSSVSRIYHGSTQVWG